jgi:hypothetical protein
LALERVGVVEVAVVGVVLEAGWSRIGWLDLCLFGRRLLVSEVGRYERSGGSEERDGRLRLARRRLRSMLKDVD